MPIRAKKMTSVTHVIWEIRMAREASFDGDRGDLDGNGREFSFLRLVRLATGGNLMETEANSDGNNARGNTDGNRREFRLKPTEGILMATTKASFDGSRKEF